MRTAPLAGLLPAMLLLYPGSAAAQNTFARTRFSISGGMAWYKSTGDAFGAYGVQGGVSLQWQDRPSAVAVQIDARGYSLGFGRAEYDAGLLWPPISNVPPRGLMSLQVGILTPTDRFPIRARLGLGLYLPTDRAATNATAHFGLEAALRFPLSVPGRGAYFEAGYVMLYSGSGQRGSLVPVGVGYCF
jgi:hypothetical protein